MLINKEHLQSTNSPDSTTTLSGCYLDLVKERVMDWHSKPQCYCVLTCIDCDSIRLSHIKGRIWTLGDCIWQQCQLWEGVLPHAVCFECEQKSPQVENLLHLVGICCWQKWIDSEFTAEWLWWLSSDGRELMVYCCWWRNIVDEIIVYWRC